MNTDRDNKCRRLIYQALVGNTDNCVGNWHCLFPLKMKR